MLYAGTDKNGLVYRIDAQGKGFVLYSTPQTEVRSLLVTAEGVYAGTSSPTRRRSSAPAAPGGSSPLLPSAPRAPGTPASAGSDNPKTAAEGSGAAIGPAAASASVDPFDKSNPASSNPPPLVGENSLYRIAPD